MTSVGANTWSVPLEINNLEARVTGGGGSVTSVTGGNGISVSGTTSVTVTNNISAGNGVSITGTNPLTITNNISQGAGISITGVNPLTIGVSSPFTPSGITNSGLFTNNGNFICNIPSASTANFNTGKIQFGNDISSTTDGYVICNGGLQCNNNLGLEVNNGRATFFGKTSTYDLLTIYGGIQGSPIYTKIPMNLVYPYYNTLTVNNISNCYIYSDTNPSNSSLTIQLPSTSLLVAQFGNNVSLEFYVAQCNILANPIGLGPPGSYPPYNGILVISSANTYVTTDLKLTGTSPSVTATIAPLPWDTSGYYIMSTATYRCEINIQNNSAYYNFRYTGKPLPSAGW